MTNEEAAKMLTAKVECMKREVSGTDFDCNFRNCYKCDLNYEQGTIGEQIEALRMAISALEKQDVPDTNVGDMISRQAAIDAIANCTNCGDEKTLRAYVQKHNLDNGWTGGVLEAIDAIEDLPSAQPEPTLEQIEEYCHKRCLSIVDNALLHKYAQAEIQPETAKRIVGKSRDGMTMWYQCDTCNEPVDEKDTFCSGCGRRFVND